MSQRTILVAQAAHFLDLMMKFKTFLSSAEHEIQSMVDFSIHQEDTAVQRTPLIDIVISMVTEKTTSTPTPPTTQAQVTNKVEAMPKRAWTEKDQQRTDEMLKMIDNLLMERQIMRSLESLVGGRNIKTDKRLLPRTV
ncbi:hypothetical protein Tco_0887010 [Tanacetum coccineum]